MDKIDACKKILEVLEELRQKMNKAGKKVPVKKGSEIFSAIERLKEQLKNVDGDKNFSAEDDKNILAVTENLLTLAQKVESSEKKVSPATCTKILVALEVLYKVAAVKKITAEGKEKILAEIEKLNEDLKKLRENKASAYTMTGDTWHDNPYFNQLERDEGRLLIQIGELQNLLKEAKVIETVSRSTDTVKVGSIFKCTYRYEGDSDAEETIYEIVIDGEADIEKGKISQESLVAKNLIGHKLNETVTFATPVGKVSYTIIKFYKDWEETK